MYVNCAKWQKSRYIIAIINVGNLDYCRNEKNRNVQDPKMEFSIIDLSVGKEDQSNWERGFVLGQWFQTMSDIP